MALFKVRLYADVVIEAKDTVRAAHVAYDMQEQIAGNFEFCADPQTVAIVTSTKDLPGRWKGMSIPYNTDHSKTIQDILSST